MRIAPFLALAFLVAPLMAQAQSTAAPLQPRDCKFFSAVTAGLCLGVSQTAAAVGRVLWGVVGDRFFAGRRKALYVNVAHTSHFKGWSEEESAPLLAYLFEHQVRPEFTCRFQWKPGSLAFWDNRCAQHNPVNDYHGYKRLMHRVTVGEASAF